MLQREYRAGELTLLISAIHGLNNVKKTPTIIILIPSSKPIKVDGFIIEFIFFQYSFYRMLGVYYLFFGRLLF